MQPMLLQPDAVSELLNVHPSTLAKWRVTGDGPKFVKIGSKVAYRPADIEAWLDSRATSSTSGARTQR